MKFRVTIKTVDFCGNESTKEVISRTPFSKEWNVYSDMNYVPLYFWDIIEDYVSNTKYLKSVEIIDIKPYEEDKQEDALGQEAEAHRGTCEGMGRRRSRLPK